jgi:hypothetical protein
MDHRVKPGGDEVWCSGIGFLIRHCRACQSRRQLSILIVLDASDAVTLMLLLFQKIDYAGRKLSPLSGRKTLGTFNFLPAIFGCFRAQ